MAFAQYSVSGAGGSTLPTASAIRTSVGSFAVLGDSIDGASVLPGDLSDAQFAAGSTGSWLQLISNGRYRQAIHSAVGGYTTTQMLNILLPQVLAATRPKPDFCLVGGGRNDCTSWGGADTALANLTDIFRRLIAARIVPVYCNVPPKNSATFVERYNQREINLGMRFYCDFHKLPYIDRAYLMSDRATGEWAAGLTGDGVHPTSAAVQTLADEAWKVLTGGTPATSGYLPITPTDSTKIVTYDPLINHRNTCMMIDVDGVANYPDGFSTSASAHTRSFITAANVPGRWFRTEAAGSAYTGYILFGDSGADATYNGAGTQLQIQASTSQVAVSGGTAFATTDIGRQVRITGGTGFTPGQYLITAVAAGVATLDRACGTASSVGGIGSMAYGLGAAAGDTVLAVGRMKATGFTGGADAYTVFLSFTGGADPNATPIYTFSNNVTATDGITFSTLHVVPTGTTNVVPQTYVNAMPVGAALETAQFGYYNLTRAGLTGLALYGSL